MARADRDPSPNGNMPFKSVGYRQNSRAQSSGLAHNLGIEVDDALILSEQTDL